MDANSQILRYRLSANSGFLINETGPREIPPSTPWYTEYGDASDFESLLKLGADFEVMAPITSHIDAGIEFEYGNLEGSTQTPRLYNFFLFDWTNPLPNDIYPGEAIYYETTQVNLLGTFRYYLKPSDEEMNFFFKAFGGISFVGTNLNFVDPVFRVTYPNVGVLYAKGTENSKDPKDKAFYCGLGAGGTYSITKRLALYLEVTGSFVNSDLINGVPNYDYTEKGLIQFIPSQGVGSLTGQLSLGLVYSAIPDTRINKKVSSTKSKRLDVKRTWKKKKHNKFHKKRRSR
jgi:hypothetical protein